MIILQKTDSTQKILKCLSLTQCHLKYHEINFQQNCLTISRNFCPKPVVQKFGNLHTHKWKNWNSKLAKIP